MLDLNLPPTTGNKYSQAGEELIIKQFLLATGLQSPWMCEFGAHSGQNSNLLRLNEDHNLGLVFIECDKDRFDLLRHATSRLQNVVLLHEVVGWDGEQSLSSIFLRHNLSIDSVKIWSVDIDGDDYRVFETLPPTTDLAIVEYNPTFAFDAVFINPPGENKGSSPLALCNLATRKDMFLAALTDTNLIFIHSRFKSLVAAHQLSDLQPVTSSIRLAMGYDGSIITTTGAGLDLTDEVIGVGWSTAFYPQPLPRILRKFNKLDVVKTLYSLIRIGLCRPWLVHRLYLKYKRNRDLT